MAISVLGNVLTSRACRLNDFARRLSPPTVMSLMGPRKAPLRDFSSSPSRMTTMVPLSRTRKCQRRPGGILADSEPELILASRLPAVLDDQWKKTANRARVRAKAGALQHHSSWMESPRYSESQFVLLHIDMDPDSSLAFMDTSSAEDCIVSSSPSQQDEMTVARQHSTPRKHSQPFPHCLLSPVPESTSAYTPVRSRPAALVKDTVSELPLSSLSLAFSDTQEVTSESLLAFASSSHLLTSSATDMETPQEADWSQMQSRTHQEVISSTRPLLNRCCKHNCLSFISHHSFQQQRSSFQSRSRREQRQFLLDIVSVSTTQQASHSKLLHFPLMGRKVCETAFTLALGTSKRRLRKVIQLYQSGVSTIPSSQMHTCKKTTKFTNAISWMKRYFNLIGDKMPHIEQIHLPHFLSKKAVYHLMVQDLVNEGVTDVVSVSHFYAIWDSQFKNCIIPKVRMHECL